MANLIYATANYTSGNWEHIFCKYSIGEEMTAASWSTDTGMKFASGVYSYNGL